MAEAGAGIKAGSAIVKAIQATPQPPQWPNIYDSLVALSAILDEWCAAAAGTSEVIDHEIARRAQVANSSRLAAPNVGASPFGSVSNVFSSGGSFTFGFGQPANRFVGDVKSDIADLMRSKPRLVERLNGSKRRAAGRRGLRSLMAIYFPELLTDFIDATEDRAEFARRYTMRPEQLNTNSDSQLEDFRNEAQRTYVALIEVSDRLASVIEQMFPLSAKG
ncbi:hypothetical protein [Krasilnikovia sp. M28-CT-15]|uniref:hypothetical protein n=1 Tax=Krasilnikovia sp. M28-CT-15 TaxID=3373540 RepID=UPI00399D060D